jgi:hypothetical protein
MSSRLPDSAPPLDRAGVIAVIVIRCPQQGHGSKKLGRFDRIRLLKDTEALSHAPGSPVAISGLIRARVKENLCNAHKCWRIATYPFRVGQRGRCSFTQTLRTDIVLLEAVLAADSIRTTGIDRE